MKSVIKALFLLAISPFIYSCDPVTPGFAPVPIKQAVSVHAEVICRSVCFEDGNCIILCGESSSCNLMAEQPGFQVNINVADLKKDGKFSLSSSTFKLISKDGVSILDGNLPGSGTATGEAFSIVSSVRDIIGSGALDARGGELILAISGKNDPQDPSSIVYTLDLNGYIERNR